MVYTKAMHEEERKTAQNLLATLLALVHGHNTANNVLQGFISGERIVEISISEKLNKNTITMVVQNFVGQKSDYIIIEFANNGFINDSAVFNEHNERTSGQLMWWVPQGSEAIPFARGMKAYLSEVQDWIVIRDSNSLFFKPRTS